MSVLDRDVDLAGVPWRLLLRARYAHEIDTFVASSVVREVSRCGSPALADAVARAAAAGISTKRTPDELTDDSRLAGFVAMSDWADGICPPWWPWRGTPGPLIDESGDPVIFRVLDQASALVAAAGSHELQRHLLPVLQKRAHRR